MFTTRPFSELLTTSLLCCKVDIYTLLDNYYREQYHNFGYTHLKGYVVPIHLDHLREPNTDQYLRYPNSISKSIVETYLSDLMDNNRLVVSPVIDIRYVNGNKIQQLKGLNGSTIVKNDEHQQIIEYDDLKAQATDTSEMKIYLIYIDKKRDVRMFDKLLRWDVKNMELM